MRSLPPIRKLCRNPRPTIDDIRICRAYLEVRQHLTAMNLSYEDDYCLVTVDNKIEYKSKLVSPENNFLIFLPKCVFLPRSKEKKVNKNSLLEYTKMLLKEKKKQEINVCLSASTAVSKNQVNNDKNCSIAVRSMSSLTGINDPSYENVQNVNTQPENELLHVVDLPTESSTKFESSEINLLVEGDIKPTNIKLDNTSTVIDISDSELTDGELQQNENATRIPDEGISEDKMFFSDNNIYKNEQFSPGPSHENSKPLKAIHEDFPLQEQSKFIIGVHDYPKSNDQTEFNVEWDGDDKIKIENIDKKISETILIDDTDISSNIIIIDDDDDDKLFLSRRNLDKIDLDVKDALSKTVEVHGEGNFITAVKHEVKSEANSFTTSTVNTNILQDTTKPTRKRKLNGNII